MMKKLMAMVLAGIMMCMPMTVGATGNVQADTVNMYNYARSVLASNPYTVPAERYNQGTRIDVSTGDFKCYYEDYLHKDHHDNVLTERYVNVRLDNCNWTKADGEKAEELVASYLISSYFNDYVWAHHVESYTIWGLDANGDFMTIDFSRQPDIGASRCEIKLFEDYNSAGEHIIDKDSVDWLEYKIEEQKNDD